MRHNKSKTRTTNPYVVEQRGAQWYVVHASGKKAPKRIGPVEHPIENFLAVAIRERDRKNRLADSVRLL